DDHREELRIKSKERNRLLKIETIQHYGGVCACCGESRMEFMSLDHKEGGGRQHRLKLKKTGIVFYAWLKRQGYPDGYRVLCMNCNWASSYGLCPHERERQCETLKATAS